MKRFYLILFGIFSLSLLAGGKEIFVSPSGNDKNDATFNFPIRTIEQAKRMVRKIIAEGIDNDIDVFLRAGYYRLDKTIIFDFNDFHDKYRITYKAYGEEKPIITSAVNINNWQKLNRDIGISDAAKGKIWVADMPEDIEPFRVMFENGRQLSRARSRNFRMPPNDTVKRSDSRNVFFNKDRIFLRMLPFTDQIKNWDNLSDVEVFFNPVPWCLNFISLQSVDTLQKMAYLSAEANSLPFTNTRHSVAWVENIIDYLDTPGEWCLDSYRNKIYYWPKDERQPENITVPSLHELFRVEGNIQYDQLTDIPVKNITFKNLTFECAKRMDWLPEKKGWGIQHDWDYFDFGNSMLRFRGAESCTVESCHFRNSGSSAIRLDLFAQNIEIRNNLIEHVGHMGILLCGYGPGKKDVNKQNIITNNEIHHCGQTIWHGHAIFLWQSGDNTISHNYIHDVPRKAIGICGVRSQILMKPDCDFDEASKTIRWREIFQNVDSTLNPVDRYQQFLHSRNNVVAFNRIEKTMLKLWDGSSINVSGAGKGNVITDNLLFDIPVTGIRTDDWQKGTLIKNNILHNVGYIGVIHKGENDVVNNIFINCKRAFHFRAYPKQIFVPDATIQHNIIYSESENFEPNSTYDWSFIAVSKPGTKPIPYEYDMDYNCYWWLGAKADIKKKQQFGIEQNAVNMNPEFRNLKNQDYRITNKKLLKKIDFKPFFIKISNYGVQNK